MEIQNSKQQQLTFDKGITNVPSDAICSDNTLEYAVGLTYENNEHRVIQNPELFVNTSYTILFIHKLQQHIFFLTDDDKKLLWAYKTGTQLTQASEPTDTDGNRVTVPVNDDTQIQAIGKTLVVKQTDSISYLIWNGKGYTFFKSIPEPDVRAYLTGALDDTVYSDLYCVKNGQKTSVFDGYGSPLETSIIEGQQQTYNDLVYGLYAKNKKDIDQRKGFRDPFLLRFALQLYDGSYTLVSQPILLFPAVSEHTCAIGYGQQGGWYVGNDEQEDWLQLTTFFSRLKIQNSSDYSPFADIVRNISLFVTQGIPIYDTLVDAPLETFTGNDQATRDDIFFRDGVFASSMPGSTSSYRTYKNTELAFLRALAKRDKKDIEREISQQAVFYKIAELPLKGDTLYHDIDEYTDAHTLENLTTQQQLTHDDFYSHCQLTANNIYAYNARINLAGIKRSFFPGFDFFTPYYHTGYNDYNIYVRIKTNDGNKVVKKTVNTTNKLFIWFFYPDPRADYVTITDSQGNFILDTPLTEHQALNGAFFFQGMPSPNDQPVATAATLSDNDIDTTPEYLYNQIATSEVSNPFVFNAEGYNTVGTGSIIAITTNTQALSQGQFGQYPLLVFTEEGIWAMAVDKTGLYQYTHPMSRHVCNNPKSVTQTDSAVFFTSEMGLMAITAGDVKCVSQQLAGMTRGTGIAAHAFHDFIKTCSIAYDYRDSMLWLFNYNMLVDEGNENYCWVYAINSGTFSIKALDNAAIKNVVNFYPDFLLQDDGDSTFSLLQRPDINADDNNYYAQITTRPMKLENAFALKKIVQILHVAQMNGSILLRIFASNNLDPSPDTWHEVHSLLSTPWKYYKFQYSFTNLRATDRFAGSVVVTAEERTNKLR